MSDVEDPQQRKGGRMASMMEHLQADITVAWTDLVLLLLTFTTGLLDSAVFNVWSCFVSMQTGQQAHNPGGTIILTALQVTRYT